MKTFPAETLASVCFAIVDEIEELAGPSSILGDLRGQITSFRERSESKALTLALKELLQWVATLPKETRDTVEQQLAAKGLSQFLHIDTQRVERVLKRGEISTASEYRAVTEYVNQPPENAGVPETLEKLTAMLVDFDSGGLDSESIRSEK